MGKRWPITSTQQGIATIKQSSIELRIVVETRETNPNVEKYEPNGIINMTGRLQSATRKSAQSMTNAVWRFDASVISDLTQLSSCPVRIGAVLRSNASVSQGRSSIPTTDFAHSNKHAANWNEQY